MWPNISKASTKNTPQIYHPKKKTNKNRRSFQKASQETSQSSLSSTRLQHHRQRRHTAERWDQSFACWWPKFCPTPSCWSPFVLRQQKLVKRWHHFCKPPFMTWTMKSWCKNGLTCFILIYHGLWNDPCIFSASGGMFFCEVQSSSVQSSCSRDPKISLKIQLMVHWWFRLVVWDSNRADPLSNNSFHKGDRKYPNHRAPNHQAKPSAEKYGRLHNK